MNNKNQVFCDNNTFLRRELKQNFSISTDF